MEGTKEQKLYSIVEYYNYRKEIFVTNHGWTSSLELAKQWIDTELEGKLVIDGTDIEEKYVDLNNVVYERSTYGGYDTSVYAVIEIKPLQKQQKWEKVPRDVNGLDRMLDDLLSVAEKKEVESSDSSEEDD